MSGRHGALGLVVIALGVGALALALTGSTRPHTLRAPRVPPLSVQAAEIRRGDAAPRDGGRLDGGHPGLATKRGDIARGEGDQAQAGRAQAGQGDGGQGDGGQGEDGQGDGGQGEDGQGGGRPPALLPALVPGVGLAVPALAAIAASLSIPLRRRRSRGR